MKLITYIFACFVLIGCAPPQGVVSTPQLIALPNTEVSIEAAEYKISVGDEIEVRFADREDMVHILAVQPDGLIRPPYLPAIRALGKDLNELTTEIKKTLASLASSDQKPQYILTVGDVIKIKFINNPDLNLVSRIRPDGQVTLPFIKSVMAEGKTSNDFEGELVTLYAEYLKRPDLSVSVENFSSNLVRVNGHDIPAGLLNSVPIVSLRTFAKPQVFIGGEVVKPGVINYRNNLTLLQAIIEAGGYLPTGELSSVIVLRKSAETGLMIRRDLASDLTDATTNDIPLQPFDVVVIPKSFIATVDDVVDQYLYKTTIFMQNSPFSAYYNLGVTAIQGVGN